MWTTKKCKYIMWCGGEMKKTKKNISLFGYFWLFIVGSLLGVIIEGVFCLIKKGHWETHTALVFGPFVVVYGIGAIAIYALANILYKKNIFIQFFVYFLIGALIEYFSSLIQQIVFGSVSWNYSQHFLNIGGRVSLKMTLGWGLLGIAFVKLVYPSIKKVFSKPVKSWQKIVTIIFAVFIVVDILISCLSVYRWHQRINEESASNIVEEIIDKNFDNQKMKKIYPNMEFIS